MKDQTHPITIPFSYVGSVKDPFGNVRSGFEGETTINRKDLRHRLERGPRDRPRPD